MGLLATVIIPGNALLTSKVAGTLYKRTKLLRVDAFCGALRGARARQILFLRGKLMEEILPFLVPILISLGLFTMIGWIVWVNARRRQAKIQAQTELNNRLLEKFGSAAEFVDFLQTEEGRHFLGSLSMEGLSPAERILRSVRTGVILSVAGLGGLLLSRLSGLDQRAFIIIGITALALGIGFLVSAAVSYRLSKSWGLLAATEPGKPNVFVSAP